MTDDKKAVPSVSVTYTQSGKSAKANALGMRPMQERAYEKRGEQYLLIKSPPASGKSRALMFIALDKLANQGLKQAIIVVPEKSIGASFADEPLTKYGFWADWAVVPKWNLCNAPGEDGGKVNSVSAFLGSSDKVLVCTHATFRFALAKFGAQAFDNRVIAVDEFHHVSADADSRLGQHLSQLIERGSAHIVAMTGSYFRGDAVPVLMPEDEAKFREGTVTYTYYEQLNGYEYLKQLDIGYFFYSGSYADDILNVLDPAEKTIIHIPSVNSRESTKDKIREVEHIIEALGDWQGTDPATGFQLVRRADGKVLRIADLVDDDPNKRDRVSAALKDPSQKNNRDHVDIIIALGMAKEGFDWIWCEHALTVGYRSSLTEIVQIIGRATRDAPGKTRARFSNLIAEPDASDEAVTEAINDTLKAIAASLLMEQVLAPRFNFTPKNPQGGPIEGFNYGEGGYALDKTNVGFNEDTGQFHIEIKGLAEPTSKEAGRIVREDLNEVIAAFVQDKTAIERGLFDDELVPEELTVARMGKIIKDKYPDLTDEDQEAVRQHAVAALKRAAEEVANRTPAADFAQFKPMFERVASDIASGSRITQLIRKDAGFLKADIRAGDFFILGGQTAYVAEIGEPIRAPNGETDARLRVIYSNGTESNLLLRSLQRALYKDEASRRVSDASAGPLFTGEAEDGDLSSGTIYVLRSKSDLPLVAQHGDVLHKIGVTGGDVARRIANAKLDATFLLADVEIVATYKLANINRTKLENLIHRIFDPARLDIEIRDRFGNPVIPREWFLVPLFVVDEAVEKIKDGSITEYRYDPELAALVRSIA